MTRPTGPVLYPVGWVGMIGPVMVEIVEIICGKWRLRKAIPAKIVSPKQ